MIGLTYIREKLHLSMEQVGERLGVSKQTISLWENEKSKIPDKRLRELADAFGLRRQLINSEVNDIIKLEIQHKLLQNERDKYEELCDYESLEKTDAQISELYKELESKRILKESELLLKNNNNFETYQLLNTLMKPENKINKKLVHDTLMAMSNIFLYGIVEDDDLSKALAKVLKTYNRYLVQMNDAMKEAFNGQDPFENDDNLK